MDFEAEWAQLPSGEGAGSAMREAVEQWRQERIARFYKVQAAHAALHASYMASIAEHPAPHPIPAHLLEAFK